VEGPHRPTPNERGRWGTLNVTVKPKLPIAIKRGQHGSFWVELANSVLKDVVPEGLEIKVRRVRRSKPDEPKKRSRKAQKPT